MTAQNNGSGWVLRQKAILRGAIIDGIPRGPMGLLRVLLANEDGRLKTVRMSRETIAEQMGAQDIKTVDRNMSALVACGAVQKVYCSGGRGKANVYKITIIPQYISEFGEPLERGHVNLPQNSAKPTPKNPETYPKKGEPSFCQYIQKGDGGASRAGRNVGTLDAGASPGPRPGPTRTPEEHALFVADLRTMQFGEALEREKARKRASAGELP